jgi:hypothetical protein
LVVLILGWSFLEGIGAALILPAIVALVASNFAVISGPAPMGWWQWPVPSGGRPSSPPACSPPYASWRSVFAGEVVVVFVILALTRRMTDSLPEAEVVDVVGSVLSAIGLALIVFGVLKAGEWGFVQPKPSRRLGLGCRIDHADPGRRRHRGPLHGLGISPPGSGGGAAGQSSRPAQPRSSRSVPLGGDQLLSVPAFTPIAHFGDGPVRLEDHRDRVTTELRTATDGLRHPVPVGRGLLLAHEVSSNGASQGAVGGG